MAVPDFQTLMLPLMRIVEDGAEHLLSDAIERLAIQFNLSEEDRKELLPSGRQARLDNRVGWSLTHLRKAALLESTGRGKFRITARGETLLKSNPQILNMKTLMQYPEFIEFRKKEEDTKHNDIKDYANTGQTLEEVLESSYQTLRKILAQELLDRVKKVTPRFFERLVVDLLVNMGYGGSRRDAGAAIGQSGDGGIDGIIKEDKLGLDAVFIQAKRWENTVGRPIVQAFAGSLEGQRARKGVFITTSTFSQEARDYVNRIEKKIVLIDGEQLAQYMMDYCTGITDVATYTIKKIDADYFDNEL
jgi:restriction system protein